MNNKEAYTLLTKSENPSNAARNYIEMFDLEEDTFQSLKMKFGRIKLTRTTNVKNQTLEDWNCQPFEELAKREFTTKKFTTKSKSVSIVGQSTIDSITTTLCEICICEKKTVCLKCPGIFTEESSFVPRKQITELQFESQRSRLTVLLQHIRYIADRERVEEKDIASLALKLISTIVHDRKVSKVCTEILQTGTFSNSYKQLPIDKSASLLDILEIGKRKYSNTRKLCNQKV